MDYTNATAEKSSNFKAMTRRFSFEFKIAGILLVILALVALTGIFAYQRRVLFPRSAIAFGPICGF